MLDASIAPGYTPLFTLYFFYFSFISKVDNALGVSLYCLLYIVDPRKYLEALCSLMEPSQKVYGLGKQYTSIDHFSILEPVIERREIP